MPRAASVQYENDSAVHVPETGAHRDSDCWMCSHTLGDENDVKLRRIPGLLTLGRQRHFSGAGVKTNLLFFTRGQRTQRIWYYDLSWVKVGKKTPLTLADKDNAGKPFPSYARLAGLLAGDTQQTDTQPQFQLTP